MLWIEAALAFAITMTILSTVASVIIETGHRIGRTRERGLRQLANKLYQGTIQPLLPGTTTADSETFVTSMTSSSFYQTDRVPVLDKVINAPALTGLNERDFIRRFGATPEGQALYQQHEQSRDTLETLLQHIINRFNEIGHDASDYFKRRAGLYSLAIGLLLAFSLNIDTPHLFQTFLGSKDVRITLSEQAEQLQQRVELREIGRQEDLKPLLQDLQQNSLPVGWHTAPWNQSRWKTDNRPLALIQWSLSLILSGLLIGLGGPFWFDTYRKLGVLAGLHSNRPNLTTPTTEVAQDDNEWLALFEQSVRASQCQQQPAAREPHTTR